MGLEPGYDVVIPTYDRTPQLVKCLAALKNQSILPGKVIVVDALNASVPLEISIMDLHPIQLIYFHNEKGRGNTANSRNLGLEHVTREITAYLDDDCYVMDGWSESMLNLYNGSDYVAIGGRTLNGMKYEHLISTESMGTISLSGEVIGNFAAMPDSVIQVDHMLGANCSWRTSTLRELGGHYDEYDPGPACLMEETEVCLRARDQGLRIAFNPLMLAFHEGAPQPNSFRFSPKYHYFHMRNQVFMLLRTTTYRTRVFKLFHVTIICRVRGLIRSVGGHILKGICEVCGMVAGLCLGVFWSLSNKHKNLKSK
jgi:GT2 family glycosyltransferase